MFNFLVGRQKQEETTKNETPLNTTITNTNKNDVLKQANTLIETLKNKETPIKPNTTNIQNTNKNLQTTKPLNNIPKRLNFRQFENNLITRNPFDSKKNNQIPNLIDKKNNQIPNPNLNPSPNPNAKIPKLISTFQTSPKNTNFTSNKPSISNSPMLSKLGNLSNLPNSYNSLKSPKSPNSLKSPNSSDLKTFTTKNNKAKIGTVTLHLNKFRFENKKQLKGSTSKVIKHLITFTSGTYPPKFNKSFAPMGHPKMNNEQISFVLLSLLKALNPSGFTQLINTLIGNTMSKPKGITFKDSPVRVIIDLNKSHKRNQNRNQNRNQSKQQNSMKSTSFVRNSLSHKLYNNNNNNTKSPKNYF